MTRAFESHFTTYGRLVGRGNDEVGRWQERLSPVRGTSRYGLPRRRSQTSRGKSSSTFRSTQCRYTSAGSRTMVAIAISCRNINATWRRTTSKILCSSNLFLSACRFPLCSFTRPQTVVWKLSTDRSGCEQCVLSSKRVCVFASWCLCRNSTVSANRDLCRETGGGVHTSRENVAANCAKTGFGRYQSIRVPSRAAKRNCSRTSIV